MVYLLTRVQMVLEMIEISADIGSIDNKLHLNVLSVRSSRDFLTNKWTRDVYHPSVNTS